MDLEGFLSTSATLKCSHFVSSLPYLIVLVGCDSNEGGLVEDGSVNDLGVVTGMVETCDVQTDHVLVQRIQDNLQRDTNMGQSTQGNKNFNQISGMIQAT